MRTFPFLVHLLVLKLLTIAVAVSVSHVPADETIRIFEYTFEDFENAVWTDESRGGEKWKVERADQTVNDIVRPPSPSRGSNYLRLHPSSDGTFAPAIFMSSYYETGGQQFEKFSFSFDYWLNSEYFEHNNMEVYLYYDDKYQRLKKTAFYRHSLPNSEWHTYNANVDVNVNILERFAIVVFGFCGLSDLDGIAIDNIFLSGIPITSTGSTNVALTSTTTSTLRPVTESTESSTESISTSLGTSNTAETASTTVSTRTTILTESVTFTSPITGTTEQLDVCIIMAENYCQEPDDQSEKFPIVGEECTRNYCVCDDNGGARNETCSQGSAFDSEEHDCLPCGQVEECRGQGCNERLDA